MARGKPKIITFLQANGGYRVMIYPHLTVNPLHISHHSIHYHQWQMTTQRQKKLIKLKSTLNST
jgi:hypothetical protein